MFQRIAPEQHDTLDDVPEPSENPHLIGHAEPSGMLASAYRAGKLPHALLFAGPSGIGKATLAFHLAWHLLAHSQSAGHAPPELARPDPDSPLFRQLAVGAHPSVLHLTRPPNDKGTGFKTVVTVDEIRKVNNFLSLTSHDGGYRIVIVDPADDMNVNAANALLKNLEEPPRRTVFILIAHSAGRLLPTIRSRCQLIRFAPLLPDELLSALDAVGVPAPAEPGAGHSLVARAGGSVRTAILLMRYGGVDIAEATEKLARGQELNAAAAHRLADAVGGRDAAIPFGLFNAHALAMLAEAARSAALAGDIERAGKLSQCFEDLCLAIDDAETYNLDRKQHALSMIVRLHDTFLM